MRTKLKLSPSAINSTKNSFVIAKPSFEEKHKNDTTELRYMFSHIEKEISLARSPNQNLVYLIFKSMFYRYIIPIDEENISSYIAKTTMFWMCEKYPKNHNFWEDNSSTIKNAVVQLFIELLKTIQNGFLAYFFIPEINILRNIQLETLRKAKHLIRSIIKNMSQM